MARTPIDWEAKWKQVQKENRKLAKRANQRLVRLERAAKKPGMQSILGYSYKSAMRDIKSLGKVGKMRFPETISEKDYEDKEGNKLTGQAHFRANYIKQLTAQKMMREFLGAATSTIGEGISGAAEGLNKSIGIKRVWNKTTKTINRKFLQSGALTDYDLRLSDEDMKRFFNSRKQAKLEKEVGSGRMFVVAAIMKKYNLSATKTSLQRYIKDHVDTKDLPEEDYKYQKGEKFEDYFKRVSSKVDLTFTDDKVLDKFILKALKEGVGASTLFSEANSNPKRKKKSKKKKK